MANRYANLVGSNKIKDEYQKINQGFDAVEADMDQKADAGDLTNLQNTVDDHIGSGGAAHAEATTSSAGFMAAADKQKLDGIEDGAQVNQNAYAKVNGMEADDPSDEVTIEGGTGITVTQNPNEKKVTITATGEATPGPHGTSHTEHGADPIPNATTTEGGLMSASDKGKLDAATSAATPNTIVQRDSAGRFKAAAPSASDDVARKAEVDGKVSKSGDTMTGPLDVRSDGIPTVIVRRENREDWIALVPPISRSGAPYSSKIVIKSENIGQDPTEYEMVRFNSSLGNVGKQISFLTSNVERVRVEDSITTILNGLWVTGQIYRGTGSPEGSVSAPVGSIYHRTDGGAGTTLYVKESGTGNTGWVAK